MKKINLNEVFEIVCRLYVFIFLNIYGIGKIMGGQFYTKSKIPGEVAATPLGQAGSFELAWTFMGHSFYYILFIGLSEILGAWLLLFRRTKLIGVIILVPIMLNIIIFDIIFLDAYGALGSAIIYFCMLLRILFFHKEKVAEIFRIVTEFPPGKKPPLKERIYKLGLALIIIALIFTLDQLIVNVLGHGKG